MAVQAQDSDDQTGLTEKRSPITHEAIERLKKISEQILQDRGGKLFEDSAEMISQMREERSRYLEHVLE